MSRTARNGFSILETVAILVIIALLMLIVIPQFTRPTLAAVAVPDSVVAPGSFGKLAVKVSSSSGDCRHGAEAGARRLGDPRKTSLADKPELKTINEVRYVTDSAGVANAVWQAAADTGALSVTARAAGRSRPALVIHTSVRGPVAATSAAPAARGKTP